MPVFLKAIVPKRIFADPAVINRQVKFEMRNYIESIKAELQVYPPESTNRKRIKISQSERIQMELEGRGEPGRFRPYRRTYKLRHGWKTRMANDGSIGVVFNEQKYAVYVQGPRGGGRKKGQHQTAALRQKGWKSITDVSRAARKRFQFVMNRAVVGSRK